MIQQKQVLGKFFNTSYAGFEERSNESGIQFTLEVTTQQGLFYIKSNVKCELSNIQLTNTDAPDNEFGFIDIKANTYSSADENDLTCGIIMCSDKDGNPISNFKVLANFYVEIAEPTYTNDQLAVILHAQSLLIAKDLPLSAIGAQIPRP